MPDTSHPHFPDERSIGLERLSPKEQAKADAAFCAFWAKGIAENEARIARIRAEDAARMAALRNKHGNRDEQDQGLQP